MAGAPEGGAVPIRNFFVLTECKSLEYNLSYIENEEKCRVKMSAYFFTSDLRELLK